MEKIIQITAGKGPAECTLLVAKIFQKIMEECKDMNISCTILQEVKAPKRETFHSLVLKIKGMNTSSLCEKWSGSIQWICQSPYRKMHKRKNWFAAVQEIRIENCAICVKDQDITYQAIRSGGPGGQHVNKVSTAIRACHLPSGISVHVSDSRSQLQNKKIAKERIMELMSIDKMQKQKADEKQNWMNHNTLQRGNPIRTFKGENFKER